MEVNIRYFTSRIKLVEGLPMLATVVDEGRSASGRSLAGYSICHLSYILNIDYYLCFKSFILWNDEEEMKCSQYTRLFTTDTAIIGSIGLICL